ncbi:MAG TPA: ferritin-like domain-containing protein [Candidatus Acidoferrum sp.]|nr:ferritin-like domain-containing protein [Candidatus Acidoferrum sp.]
MSGLREAFIEELKDTYDAEHQITRALPKVIKSARHEELKSALESHLEETHNHIGRLENVFDILDETPRRKKCKGIEGILAEGQELIEAHRGDAALIASLQKVEHYEIAAYGTLAAWTRFLEEHVAADILEETLNEERDADERLAEIAQSVVNPEGASREAEEGFGRRIKLPMQ